MNTNTKIALIVFALLLAAGVLSLNVIWPGRPTTASIHFDATWGPTSQPVQVRDDLLQQRLLIALDDLAQLTRDLRSERSAVPASQPIPVSQPVKPPTATSAPATRPVSPVPESRPAKPEVPTSRPASQPVSRPATTSKPAADRPIVENPSRQKMSFPQYDKQMTDIIKQAMEHKDFKKAVQEMSELTSKYAGYHFEPNEEIIFPFWKLELRKYADQHPEYESAANAAKRGATK